MAMHYKNELNTWQIDHLAPSDASWPPISGGSSGLTDAIAAL